MITSTQQLLLSLHFPQTSLSSRKEGRKEGNKFRRSIRQKPDLIKLEQQAKKRERALKKLLKGHSEAAKWSVEVSGGIWGRVHHRTGWIFTAEDLEPHGVLNFNIFDIFVIHHNGINVNLVAMNNQTKFTTLISNLKYRCISSIKKKKPFKLGSIKISGTNMKVAIPTFDPREDVNQLAHVSLCVSKPQQRPG